MFFNLQTLWILALQHSFLELSPAFWLVMTDLGLFGLVLPALIAIAPLPHKRDWWVASGVLAITWLFEVILKWGINEPRPLQVLGPALIHYAGPSLSYHGMPSGHSMTAFFLVSFMAYYQPRKTLAWLVVMIWACTASISRIMVGAHWPLDVVFGALLGALMPWALLKLFAHLFPPTALPPPQKNLRTPRGVQFVIRNGTSIKFFLASASLFITYFNTSLFSVSISIAFSLLLYFLTRI